jgi:hypothetical protein
MYSFDRVYHVGIRVPDIDEAMADLGKSMDLTWAKLQQRDQPVWTPSTGATTVPLRFTYSCEGPVHWELLEGAPGTIWDGREVPGAHHVGVWSSDVAGDTEALVADGWTVAAGQKSPEDGYGAFTYVTPRAGLIVELVSDALLPMFDRWWAGGDLR